MNLEARIAGFQHDVIVLDRQLINAIDRELKFLTPQSPNGVVQGVVARHRNHGIQAEVFFAQGRQYAHQGNVTIVFRSALTRHFIDFLKLGFHQLQAVTAHHMRREVCLHVEQSEFMSEPFIADGIQDFHRFGCGLVRLVDQEHLLLSADAADARFDHSALQHAFQRANFIQQSLHEGLMFDLAVVSFDVLFTHQVR